MDFRRDIAAQIHASLRAARRMGRGAQNNREDATPVRHKEYPRMPHIPLPHRDIGVSLSDAFAKRTSFIGSWQSGPLELADASALFLGMRVRAQDAHGSRPYPSGGSRYPIEAYIIGSIGTEDASVYHYHPSAHELEQLWQVPDWFFSMGDIFPTIDQEPIASTASCAIVLTAAWERSTMRYGDFAYLLAVLEAGHIAQNMLLAAASIDLGVRPMQGFADETVCDLLNLKGDAEQPLYALSIHPHRHGPH